MSKTKENNEELNKTSKINDDILTKEEKRIKFLKEIKLLVGETNDDLSSHLAHQTNITSQLQKLKKETQGHNNELKASVNLSKQVEKAIRDSVNAGQDMNQIEKSINKNKNTTKQIIQQIKAVSDVNGKTDKDILDNAINFAKTRKELLKSVEEEKTITLQITADQAKRHESLKRNRDIELEISKLKSEMSDSSIIDRQINDNKIKDLQKESYLNSDKISQSEKSLSKNLEILSTVEKVTTEKQKEYKLQKEILPIEEQQAIALSDSALNLNEVNVKLNEELAVLENINNALGLSGQGIAIMNKLFGGQLGFLKDVKKNSEDILRAEIDKRKQHNLTQKALLENGKITKSQLNLQDESISKMYGFGVQVVQAGKALKANLLDPMVYIGLALSFDKEINELSKGLATTETQTRQIRRNLGAMAADFNRLGISSAELLKTATSLNKQMGTAFSPDIGLFKSVIADVSVLTDLMGLSAEAASGFARDAYSSGKSVKDIKLESLGVITALEEQNGILLDNTAVLETAGKVSGQLRAQLGDSVTEIVEAEAKARQLGMTLQSVADAGKALLDFESSISNELEAELLIGKQLNLEKARLAALTGDYKTLTEEINDNVGDFSDFQDLNVLQQQALAKAVGMTVDGLSDQLMAKEDLSKLAQEARSEGNEQKALSLERLDTEKKFAAVIMDIKQAFVDIAGGPIGDILNMVAKALGWVTSIVKQISKLTGGLSDVVIKTIVFYKMVKGIRNSFLSLKALSISIAAWRAKTLGTEIAINAQKKTGVGLTLKERIHRGAINLAEKLGLITKRQGVMIKTREQMLNKTAIVDTSAKNFYENATLVSTLRRNAAKLYENTISKAGLGIDAARDAWAKSTLLTKIGEGTARLYNNSIAAIGQGIDAVRDAWAKSTLFTRIAEGVVKLTNILRSKVALGLDMIGLSTTVAKGAAETVITTSKGAQLAFMPGLITTGLTRLGIAVATAAASLTTVSALTLGIGTIVALAAAAAGIAWLTSKTNPSRAVGGEIIGKSHNQGGEDYNLEGGEFVINKQAAGIIGNKDLNSINTGKLPVKTANQQVVQNNKVMESKLDRVYDGLLMIADKTGNSRAYVVENPNEIPSMGNYANNFQDASVNGGTGAVSRGGLA